jgi:hypothetical protein
MEYPLSIRASQAFRQSNKQPTRVERPILHSHPVISGAEPNSNRGAVQYILPYFELVCVEKYTFSKT